jgi:phosphoribosyl 1,2-cyclic phosphodiesterase
LNHPGGCAGFRIQANGVSVAYLSDHEPSKDDSEKTRADALVEFVHDVDLLILDTQYNEEEFQHRRGWGHGCLTDSVAMAVRAGARELAFFHHDPTHTDDRIDAMLERGRELSGGSPLIINAARENQTMVLGRTKSEEMRASCLAGSAVA